MDIKEEPLEEEEFFIENLPETYEDPEVDPLGPTEIKVEDEEHDIEIKGDINIPTIAIPDRIKIEEDLLKSEKHEYEIKQEHEIDIPSPDDNEIEAKKIIEENDTNFVMAKKITKLSRGSRKISNVMKLNKVAITGEERICEYRARIRAAENSTSIESKGTAVQKTLLKNLKANPAKMHENHHSLLYQALTRQNRQVKQKAVDDYQQFAFQVEVHQQNLPLLSESISSRTVQMQSSTQNATGIKRQSETAQTPAKLIEKDKKL
uniref:Uncharacterized protein n=1 Tax=Clastoptera arizonana TaxID=38151 RepID=A0A1B6D3E5_9HEMI